MKINNYYVVLKGNLNGPAIFTDYADCVKAVSGCEDAKFESFENIEDAYYYLIGNKEKRIKIKDKAKRVVTELPISVISYKVNESDFETINSKYANTICMYVSGGYNYAESKGHYSVLIKKYAKVKHVKKDSIENSTPNRIMIRGIIDSLDYISDNNEMEITVFVATSLGFKTACRNRGNNADLILELYKKVQKKNLRVTFVEILGKAQDIKDYIKSLLCCH
ncbi:RNase H1/viroplasmin domain-containing protein [Acetivibrio straminisolvens]|uniref:Ribonuclease H1 N-terminal domain-containing protein n=1 Tax=Acetivibrio straminisolvens JCM 21531 TaxID=1294263 RepID=W4VBG5_9FIRM|nr:RNase H1/viroplasmin domain-containing protein [Acetivibrio straminisolvens]GAE90516.1 hypothetical protein JCM21531_4135 [Acetivibrio straminisolvens JCM 21531]